MVYKSIENRKLPLICFYNNVEKVQMELAVFSIEKVHVTSDICTVIDNSYEPISHSNFDSYCENHNGLILFMSCVLQCVYLLQVVSLMWRLENGLRG